MKNKRRISDEALEQMLGNYCSRTPERIFEFKEGRRTSVKSTFLKAAVVGVCAAAALTVIVLPEDAFFKRNGDTDTSAVSTSVENKLIVNASAAEATSVGVDFKINTDEEYQLLGATVPGTETLYFLDDGNGTPLEGDELNAYIESGEAQYNGYDVITQEDVAISYGCIIIDVQGQNLDHYDVTTESGDVFVKASKDYFEMGKAIYNIPYDEDNPHNILLEWVPSSEIYHREIFDETGDGTVTIENCQKRLAAVEEKLQTADDYTRMFGDTVTIIAYYKDGTSEVMTAVITLDENGSYQVEYV